VAVDKFNVFKASLRNYVLESATVTTLIGQRFYGAYLATIFHTDDMFPLATFEPESGQETLVSQIFNMNIRAYSERSYDDAHNVYDAIHDRLRHVTIVPRIVIYADTSPGEHYDEISRLYSVTGRYKVTRFLVR
jgi:hypothetical protein